MILNPRFCLLAIFGCVAPYAYADPIQDQRLYRSAAYLARGDTGIAIADDYEAIFYNPAGLAQGEGIYKQTVFLSPQFDLSVDTRNLVRKLAIEKKNDPETFRQHVGKNQHFGLSNFSGVVFRRAAVGLLASTNNDFLLRKSEVERGAEVLSAKSVSNIGATFSFAERFYDDRLLIGTTLKYLQQAYAALEINVLDSENIADQLADDDNRSLTSGIGADLGMIWIIPGKNPLHIGATIENVGTTQLRARGEEESGRRLKQVFNLGLSYTVHSHISRMVMLLDFRDVTGELSQNFFKRLHIGAELALGKTFGLMGGWHQGYPGGGMYLNIYLMRFDVGAYTQELGTTAGAREDIRYMARVMVKI